VPYADSAPLSAKLLRNGTLKTYKGFSHGMPTTEADTINADLLETTMEPTGPTERALMARTQYVDAHGRRLARASHFPSRLS
jgi:hypothetical protein